MKVMIINKSGYIEKKIIMKNVIIYKILYSFLLRRVKNPILLSQLALSIYVIIQNQALI